MEDDQIERELEQELREGLKVYRDLDKIKNSCVDSKEEDAIFKLFFDQEFQQENVGTLVKDFAGYMTEETDNIYEVEEGAELYYILEVDQNGNRLSDVNIRGFQVSWEEVGGYIEYLGQSFSSQLNIFPGTAEDFDVCESYLEDRF